jgi:sialate O-acetylesterase
MKKRDVLIVCFLFLGMTMKASIWMPSVFSDNMVLQQQQMVPLWGWTSNPGETIRITGSWNQDTVSVVAVEGVWRTMIETPDAGGPYTVTVVGNETVVIHNVLIGEVWLCSGQSNMEWTPQQGLVNLEQEQKAANYPEIRFFTVPKHKSSYPQDNTPGKWVVCTPETFLHFSAVGFFFAREVFQQLHVPMGMINASWGGSPIEDWIPAPLIKQNPELSEAAKKLKKVNWWPTTPGVAYNAMIAPLIPYTIAGVLWYQGESNRVNASSYYTSLPLLIRSWRDAWGEDFSFYFAQIAPYDYKDDNVAGAVVRDAELMTMKTVPGTGMAVTNDIGNLKDIHPHNKQEVGRRLALWALAHDYHRPKVVFTGPVYKEMEVDGNKVILSFDHAEGGLKMDGKELKAFTIAGEDRVFVPAKARIKDGTVEVWSPKVKKPVAVRFGFSDIALPNLTNGAGLPASAFRTDNWDVEIKTVK